MPDVAWFVPVAVAVSTFGALSSFMLLSPRLGYVAAREGHMMQFISMIHINKFTPAPSIVLMVTQYLTSYESFMMNT